MIENGDMAVPQMCRRGGYAVYLFTFSFSTPHTACTFTPGFGTPLVARCRMPTLDNRLPHHLDHLATLAAWPQCTCFFWEEGRLESTFGTFSAVFFRIITKMDVSQSDQCF
jgi:hypothetical protein